MDEEGVEVIIVGESDSRSPVCRKRPKSENGKGVWNCACRWVGGGGVDGGCLDGVGKRVRLDFGVVLGSRDSKSVTSLDTAISVVMGRTNV